MRRDRLLWFWLVLTLWALAVLAAGAAAGALARLPGEPATVVAPGAPVPPWGWAP